MAVGDGNVDNVLVWSFFGTVEVQAPPVAVDRPANA